MQTRQPPAPDTHDDDPAPRRVRRWLLVIALVLLAAGIAASVALDPWGDDDDAGSIIISNQASVADEIVDAVNPSVVSVFTYAPTFSPGATGRAPTGAGSGWAYTNNGYVITNAHVVDGVDEVDVITFAGEVMPATVVGADWYQDVAVIRLEPDADQALPPAATVGDSSRFAAGDPVIAIGTPGGRYANTVSVGAVSGVGRAINAGSGYSIRNLIQHSAALASGNSGGPLFSMDGEVVGMNVASRVSRDGEPSDAEAISFAIDGDAVLEIADEIIATGAANRPWLGVAGGVAGHGHEVRDVEPGSPAEIAGLEPGDVVTHIDDYTVNEDGWFIDLLYQYNPGDTVKLAFDREGESTTVEVTLGSPP
jgi:S1-C subfamily serine protease